MRSTASALVTGIVLLTLLTGCGTPTPTPVPPFASPTTAPALAIADPTGLGPVESVSAFYGWYLAYSSGSGQRNPLVDEAYRRTGYVTARWQDQVAPIQGSPGGSFDPFLCAQDVPEQVLPFQVHQEGGWASVEVRTSFPGHAFTVRLQQVGQAWQIDEVRCQGGSAAPPTAAPATVQAEGGLYTSEEFGFRVQYPEEWVVREVRARMGEPPIGPEGLRLMVLLMPAEWAQAMDRPGPPDPDAPAIAPLTLEVMLASEEEFRAYYPAPARSEGVQLAHAPALYTVEAVTEEINIPRYVLVHPVAANLRVVLTDPVSGFPDRLAAYPEVAAAFQELADSFAWLD